MKVDRKNHKRIALGLIAMALIWLVGNELTTFFQFQTSPAIQGVLISLLGAGLGGFIARRGFLFPALALWLLIQALVIYVLYMIAEPTGQASLAKILSYNWISFISSAVVTTIGAILGERISKHWPEAAIAT